MDATQIIDVIKNDLERTGEFILIPSTEMLSIPTSPDSVIHRDWLLLDADAIIFLTTEKLGESIDIAYSIYDIRAKKIVLKKKIYGVPDGLRQSSHYVSDGFISIIMALRVYLQQS